MNEINIEECLNKIDEIALLENNWNDNGANKFSSKIIDNVKKFLSYSLYNPFIAPTANNSIQLEYEKNNDEYFEVEIYEDKIETFKIDIDKKETEQVFSIDEFFKVLNLVKIFYNGNPQNAVLFTGAFNPPTIAHYHMVHSVLRNNKMDFDYVIFALSTENFLKKKQSKTNDWYFSENERIEMVLSMIAHNPNALLYGIEIGYTYDVLCSVKQEFNCKNLYFACGSDKLNEIERWGNAKKLLKEFNFYILLRGVESYEYIENKCNKIFINTKYFLAKDNEKYKDISATQVRNKIKQNLDYTNLLEPHVYKYLIKNKEILNRRLYAN